MWLSSRELVKKCSIASSLFFLSEISYVLDVRLTCLVVCNFFFFVLFLFLCVCSTVGE